MAAAARVGDSHICPASEGSNAHVGGPIQTPVSLNVMIGGVAAARQGDKCLCTGPIDTITGGSSSVLINGKSAARQFDATLHGGKITSGFMMVEIG